MCTKLTEVFLCYFLSCKATARIWPTKTGHGLHSSKIFVLFYILFVLCHSVYCLYVSVYCTTATGWLPIAVNEHIISYISNTIPYHICADVDNTPSALYKIHHYEQLPVVSHVFFIPWQSFLHSSLLTVTGRWTKYIKFWEYFAYVVYVLHIHYQYINALFA